MKGVAFARPLICPPGASRYVCGSPVRRATYESTETQLQLSSVAVSVNRTPASSAAARMFRLAGHRRLAWGAVLTRAWRSSWRMVVHAPSYTQVVPFAFSACSFTRYTLSRSPDGTTHAPFVLRRRHLLSPPPCLSVGTFLLLYIFFLSLLSDRSHVMSVRRPLIVSTEAATAWHLRTTRARRRRRLRRKA